MQTIIGLGKAGCNIADKFSQYPQYTTYKIDVGLKKGPDVIIFPNMIIRKNMKKIVRSLKNFLKGHVRR